MTTEHKPHKRPVTREGIALLIEDCEKTSAALSMRPTPFQLEQAVNFLVSTVPAALRSLEEQLEAYANFVEACGEIIVRSRDPLTEISERLKDFQ